MSGRAEFRWNVDEQKLIEGVGITNDLQYFLAQEVARYMTPYVPMDTGMLQGTYDIESFPDRATITYNQPYAHYQYYGTSFNHNTQYHPLATAMWDKAMWVAHKDQIMAEVDACRKRLAR